MTEEVKRSFSHRFAHRFQAAEQCLGAVVLDASAAAPVAQLQRLAEAMLRHLAARFRAPEAGLGPLEA